MLHNPACPCNCCGDCLLQLMQDADLTVMPWLLLPFARIGTCCSRYGIFAPLQVESNTERVNESFYSRALSVVRDHIL